MTTPTLTESDNPRPGLRERKKARTRAAIQEHALRLFREQGYETTTIEQIADAAEISPSTFFRYFPTKEDVVLYDALDPIFLEALRRQPPDVPPIAALRAAMREVLLEAVGDEMAKQMERGVLLMSVADLRMRALDQIVSSLEVFSVAVGERIGRAPDDPRVRTIVGAVMGAVLIAWLGPGATSGRDLIERMDESLALLEAGLPN